MHRPPHFASGRFSATRTVSKNATLSCFGRRVEELGRQRHRAFGPRRRSDFDCKALCFLRSMGIRHWVAGPLIQATRRAHTRVMILIVALGMNADLPPITEMPSPVAACQEACGGEGIRQRGMKALGLQCCNRSARAKPRAARTHPRSSRGTRPSSARQTLFLPITVVP